MARVKQTDDADYSLSLYNQLADGEILVMHYAQARKWLAELPLYLSANERLNVWYASFPNPAEKRGITIQLVKIESGLR